MFGENIAITTVEDKLLDPLIPVFTSAKVGLDRRSQDGIEDGNLTLRVDVKVFPLKIPRGPDV